MKVIKAMLLMVSLFAIAGAAFFQLFVLLASKLSTHQDTHHRTFPVS